MNSIRLLILSWEIIIILTSSIFIGINLDSFLNTKPIMLIIFLMFGGIINFLKLFFIFKKELDKKD